MAAATIMRQVGVRAAFSTSALSVLSSMKLAAEMKAPVSSLAEIGAMRGSTIEATTTTRAAEIIRRARGETRRAFGAGAGKGETFEGVTIHEPEPWQQNLANGVMAAMWFWILLRAKNDGADLLFGHVRHFKEDHDDHHH